MKIIQVIASASPLLDFAGNPRTINKSEENQ